MEANSIIYKNTIKYDGKGRYDQNTKNIEDNNIMNKNPAKNKKLNTERKNKRCRNLK